MTVAANVKQVLTIVLAVLIFHLHINLTNLFGITLTLAGGAAYAKVEYDAKQARSVAVPTGTGAMGNGDMTLHGHKEQDPASVPLMGVTEEKRNRL